MPTPSPATPALAPLVHLTTVHPRRDVRIFHKEAQTLRTLGRPVILVIADGLGDEQAGPGEVRFVDVGALGRRLTRAVSGSWRAMKAVMALRPAVVHFHDPELIPMALVLKARGYTIIYDVHEDVPRQILDKHWIPRPLRWAVSKTMAAVERVAKWSFDGFVTATSQIAGNFPAARTVVVQNYPIPSELLVEGGLPYADRPQSVTYIGGIARSRGVREMIEAMALIADRRETRLEMAGPMTPASLEGELRGLPGWRAVTYHGLVDRASVARILGSARVGLVTLHPTPAYLEALPVKMFEYMAAGLPVIASDFPLWRNIVTEAGCGLLVDPLNPSAIADAITWILDHPGEAEAMGRRGQHAVTSTYTWDREAEKLLALYAKLLGPFRP
jgi:glycosyltransferase involved in cell wall biosynthesis